MNLNLVTFCQLSLSSALSVMTGQALRVPIAKHRTIEHTI